VPVDAPEILARFQAELDLVDIIARQLLQRVESCVTLDDLRSFGQEGLLQASRTFDGSLGVPFRRWANTRVRGAMIDGVRQWGGLPRRVYRQLRALEARDQVLEQYSERCAGNPATTPQSADDLVDAILTEIATLREMESVADEATPEELLAKEEALALVRRAVSALDERERALIERYYFAGDSLEQAGAAIGLSKSWASRLHAQAIASITKALRRLGET
jgi:RNA polymerase sigma factor for flagellar operon FliA